MPTFLPHETQATDASGPSRHFRQSGIAADLQ
jgi:hypothetical protein